MYMYAKKLFTMILRSGLDLMVWFIVNLPKTIKFKAIQNYKFLITGAGYFSTRITNSRLTKPVLIIQ